MRSSKYITGLPFKASCQLVWSRLTFSKLTIIYFLYSLIHTAMQVIFQGEAFAINAYATTLVDSVLTVTNTPTAGFTLLQGQDLKWCKKRQDDSLECIILYSLSGNFQPIADAAVAQFDPSSAPSPILPSSMIALSASSTISLSSVSARPSSSASISATLATSPSSVNLPASAVSTGKANPPKPVTVTTIITKVVTPTTAATPKQDNNDHGDDNEGNEKVTGGGGGGDGDGDSQIHKRHIVSQNSSDGLVLISNLPFTPGQLQLNKTCLLALNWPLETLEQTKREDIAFINFHVWVLGMSVVAILNESMVHMLATLMTHLLVTAWSGFQLYQTRLFQKDFTRFITRGACDGNNLLPDYWRDRARAEIPIAALNGVALFISAVLTWKLIKTYNWATFKRIGADRKISRAYKFVLFFSVVLQLSLFFLMTTLALWLDQLCKGPIGRYAEHMRLYMAVDIVLVVLLPIWIIIGWKGVRAENRRLMTTFIAFALVLTGGWAGIFTSTTWRWTFMQWPFFAIISVFAVFLTLLAGVLAGLCIMRFKLGLSRHLNAQECIDDDDEFINALPDDYKNDQEKGWVEEDRISFPSTTVPHLFTVSSIPRPPAKAASTHSSRREGRHSDPFRISISSAHSEKSLNRSSSGSSGSSDSSRTRNVSGGRVYGMNNNRWIIE